jgi:hypothetical protein
MGQKLVAYNAQGAVIGFYDSEDSPVPDGINAIEISDADWQACLATPGYTIVGGALVAPAAPTSAEVLATAQADQLATLSLACEAAIVAGFSSIALGSVNSYPSALKDQLNMQTALAASQGQAITWTSNLWCSAAGVWALAPHTPAQLQQVNTDFVTARTSAQSKYAGLIAQVNAAETNTVAAVQAITW